MAGRDYVYVFLRFSEQEKPNIVGLSWDLRYGRARLRICVFQTISGGRNYIFITKMI